MRILGFPAPRSAIWRETLRLAWPATLSLFLHSLYRVNDQFWIRELGSPAQAAMGAAIFLGIFNFTFITTAQSGGLARIAHYTGAKNNPGRQQVYSTLLPLCVVCFSIIGFLEYENLDFFVSLLGVEGEVAELSKAYIRPFFLCLPAMMIKPVMDGVLIGMGNTFVPMVLGGLSLLLNFVLNPLLIFGWGPVPAMGIAGAAWATLAARGIAGLAEMIYLYKKTGMLPFSLPDFRFTEARAMLKIGWPIGLNTAIYALTFIWVVRMSVAPFGEPVLAGMGIAFNGLEAISYCALMGPATACASMVGRRLGAGEGELALQSVSASLTFSIGIACFATLAFALIPKTLLGIYSADPAVLAEGALYLMIVAWTQTATAAEAVLEQALAGAGRTLWMALVVSFGLLLRIPLCWWLAHYLGWGPVGIWWGFNLSNWIKLVAIFFVFRAIQLADIRPATVTRTHGTD